MTIVDRYLLTRMCSTLLKSLLSFVCLYIMIDLLTHRDDAISNYDVPWAVIAEYYLAFSPQVIYQVAPFALLVTALLVLGDAAQNNEVTAMLAGGVSLRRFVRMPILGALAFFACLLSFQETYGTTAIQRAEEIEHTYFSRNPDLEREGMSWSNLSGEWTCHIKKFNRLALTGEGVMMHAHGDKVHQIAARRIYWDDQRNQWLLEDGLWHTFLADVTQKYPSTVIRQAPAPFDESPDELFAMEMPSEVKTARQLANDIAAMEARSVPVESLRVDYYAKFAQPALSFVMIFLAIPFAMRVRRGGLAVSFGMSIAIAMAYIVVFMITMSLGHAGRIPPIVAAWSANAIFLGTGFFMFLRTPT